MTGVQTCALPIYDLTGRRRAAGLRDLDRAGQRLDNIGGEMGAIGRGQCRVLLALEVIMQDDLVAVVGQNQVDAASLEIAMEQEMRVGNDDRIFRSLRMRWIDMNVRVRMLRTVAICGKRGVKFASVIQWTTAIR